MLQEWVTFKCVRQGTRTSAGKPKKEYNIDPLLTSYQLGSLPTQLSATQQKIIYSNWLFYQRQPYSNKHCKYSHTTIWLPQDVDWFSSHHLLHGVRICCRNRWKFIGHCRHSLQAKAKNYSQLFYLWFGCMWLADSLPGCSFTSCRSVSAGPHSLWCCHSSEYSLRWIIKDKHRFYQHWQTYSCEISFQIQFVHDKQSCCCFCGEWMDYRDTFCNFTDCGRRLSSRRSPSPQSWFMLLLNKFIHFVFANVSDRFLFVAVDIGYINQLLSSQSQPQAIAGHSRTTSAGGK